MSLSCEDGTIRFYSKSKEHKEFSNFYPVELNIDGKSYPTAEHYFQAMKFPDCPEYQETIRSAAKPGAAKKLGRSRKYKIADDWNDRRNIVMRVVVREKFRNGVLRECLLSTGNKLLIEDSPIDYYWGIGRSGTGKNMLGVILMELRSELRDRFL